MGDLRRAEGVADDAKVSVVVSDADSMVGARVQGFAFAETEEDGRYLLLFLDEESLVRVARELGAKE